MSTRALYDQWSATYDTVENKTRDLEKVAFETILADVSFTYALELGGGTGKNTSWLTGRAEHVISVDLSPEMQAIAKGKITNANVEFRTGDICKPWSFAEPNTDLIACSLILEHVDDLGFVFQQAGAVLDRGGHLYVCELHPFKQYEGSKARFETDEGLKVTECYQHHVTDYTSNAVASGFSLMRMDEWFDGDDRTTTPRLISFLFQKH